MPRLSGTTASSPSPRPAAGARGPSGSKAFGTSGGKAKPWKPREPKLEPYVPVPDVIPRADAAKAATSAANPKRAPFTVTEGVVVLSLGKTDARPAFPRRHARVPGWVQDGVGQLRSHRDVSLRDLRRRRDGRRASWGRSRVPGDGADAGRPRRLRRISRMTTRSGRGGGAKGERGSARLRRRLVPRGVVQDGRGE